MRALPRRRANEQRVQGEDGFSLAETVVALGVLAIALSLLGQNLVSGFTSVVASRQRQVATALANELLEQVRALPFDQLDMGNADLAASVAATEADLVATGTGPTLVYSFRGREIPRTEITDRAPLVPHTSTVTSEPGSTTYTRRVYVTKDPTNANGRMITALVTWTTQGTDINPQVQVETLVTGYTCAAQAGPRPCESYWHATGSGGGGTLTVSGAVRDEPAASLTATLPYRTAQVTTEQLTAVTGSSTTPALEMQQGTLTPTTADDTGSSASADDSLATSQTTYTAPASSGPVASGSVSLSRSNDGNTATLAASYGSGPIAGSAAAANAQGQTPPMGGGVIDDDNMGYGRATAIQGGAISSTLSVDPEDNTAQVTTLLSAPATGADGTATADRDPGTDPSDADDDPIRGTIDHSLSSGNVDLLTLPSGASAGTGWAGYLVRLSGWSASATAEAGPGALDASTAAAQTGTLSYWNGAGYTTVDLASDTVDAEVSATATAGGCTHVLSGGQLNAGGVTESVEHHDGDPTEAIIQARAAVNPVTLRGLSFRVTCGTAVWADLTVDIDLGATVAEARFAVPGA